MTDLTMQDTQFAIGIVGALNLDKVSAEINPYISLYTRSGSFETVTASRVSNTEWKWGNSFLIPYPEFAPLYLTLFDKDEQLDDTCIAAFKFEKAFLEKLPSAKIYLRLTSSTQTFASLIDPETTPTIVTEEDLGSSEEASSMLILEIELPIAMQTNTVKVIQHSLVKAKGKPHTSYRLAVKVDQRTWEVAVRYSKVLKLKEKLQKLYPAFKNMRLPTKTYLEWLLLPHFSRFHPRRVEQRKQAIEMFLNTALAICPFNCSLTELLSAN